MKLKGPQGKIARRLSLAHTPKASKVLELRPTPPGQHGKRMIGRPSDYKLQLLEKQRLRVQYNIEERQLRNYYKKAIRKAGNTSENLVQLLETRLDAALFRGGLTRTIYAARQIVSHGHILVNGKKVDIPSYGLKAHEVVQIKEKSRELEMIKSAMENASPPAYLELSKKDFSVTLLYMPKREEVPVICEVSRVIEFYSR